MILPQAQDALHKAWLYRLLAAIYDDSELAQFLYFKGGTCAAMLGYLDRFSIDLDFDFMGQEKNVPLVQKRMEKIFKQLDLKIKNKSQKTPQYFLKYPRPDKGRNTLKIDVTFPPPQANQYEAKRFQDIDRIIYCQNKETMFANKLVALIERSKKGQAIAGRDLYDIHHFFLKGFSYDPKVIKERTNQEPIDFLGQLIRFIEKEITEKVLTQDLNVLLAYEQFKKIRKHLKPETLMFLRDEVKRLANKN